MGRPTTIKVEKVANGDYQITCIDNETGSATGMQIPENGYEVLEHHFRTGMMEISSDELVALPISGVIDSVFIDHCATCDEFELCWKDSKRQQQCEKH